MLLNCSWAKLANFEDF